MSEANEVSSTDLLADAVNYVESCMFYRHRDVCHRPDLKYCACRECMEKRGESILARFRTANAQGHGSVNRKEDV